MKTCPNCGKNLAENETTCSNCGLNLLETEEEALQRTQEITVHEQTEYRPKRFVSKMNYGPQLFKDDDEFILLNEYIDKNVAKMKNGFSWPTFFFSSYYMFYRKMWLLGILTIIITGVIYKFIPNSLIAFLVHLIFNIIIASEFKDLYLKKALSTIDSIKADHPDATDEELAPIVKRAGGTSIGVLIIFIIGGIIAAILYGTIIYATVKTFGSDAFDFLKTRLKESQKSAEQIDENRRRGKEINMAGRLYVVFPSGFTRQYIDGSTDIIYANKQNCAVQVFTEKAETYNNDVKEYLDVNIRNNPVNEQVDYRYLTYYGHEWTYFRSMEPNKIVYATIYDGVIYNVTFSSEINMTACALQTEVIAPSFKFK